VLLKPAIANLVGLGGGPHTLSRADKIFDQLLLPVKIVTDLLAHYFKPSLPGEFSHLSYLIQEIVNQRNNRLVVYGADELPDLGPGAGPSYTDWYDTISSLIMIGVPDATTTLVFYEGTNDKNFQLHLRMPEGHYAASYYTIHQSAFEPSMNRGFTSEPKVPDPGINQEAPWFPNGRSFGNVLKSYQWLPR
jgi:hypothetical protein